MVGWIIFLAILILTFYFIRSKIAEFWAALDPAHTIGTIPGCPDGYVDDGAALCKSCPDGYTVEKGDLTCYKNTPSGWTGGQNLLGITKSRIYSPGQPIEIKGCPEGKSYHEGLCYNNSDISDPWRYGTPGFAYRNCPGDYTDVGAWCQKGLFGPTLEKIKAITGTVPSVSCPSGYELNSLKTMCYKPCSAGMQRAAGDIEFCSSVCPGDFTDMGIAGCKRPSTFATVRQKSEVGVCTAPSELRSGMCKI